MSLAMCTKCGTTYNDVSRPCPKCGGMGERVEIHLDQPAPSEREEPTFATQTDEAPDIFAWLSDHLTRLHGALAVDHHARRA